MTTIIAIPNNSLGPKESDLMMQRVMLAQVLRRERIVVGRGVHDRRMTTASSSSSASSSADASNIKERIVQAALKHVLELRWSDECLVRATKELDLPPLSHRIVSRGCGELVQHVLDQKLAHVQSVMTRTQPAHSSAEIDLDRLQHAIFSHFQYIHPYQAVWAEAIAIAISPEEIQHTALHAYRLTDELCFYGNIKTSRLDWYSERLLLAGLYGATELFYLTDKTEDLADTR